ncbi:MAG: M28 family peptidase [Candidatus Hydrogenedentes bacterium]|nr:M28 family peptidase [Candidatus Hydrogenedentota bacterium]
MRYLTGFLVLFSCCVTGSVQAEESLDEDAIESRFLSGVRQVTFGGLRSGEGYFNADGTALSFQSEREPENPFYQIYHLNLETGDIARVSPGAGKTTCSWIHPDGKHVLYASTHHDPQSAAYQAQELKDRAEGKEKRYSWDYDPEYELYLGEIGGESVRLTNARGYDAECAFSPDGKTIVFASNRHAYAEPLSAEDAKLFEVDQSLFMDLYLMDADGGQVRRITDARGYDGGPFFSHDGTQICWRRFSEDGVRAEIWVAASDGTNPRQLTQMGAMSWAPFFHPSGKYLIFTTNKHGFDNFELYLVDVAGTAEPVRVTSTPGFDGLASFSPDGKTLAWTSNRTAGKKSQIFFASWMHDEALAALGSGSDSGAADVADPAQLQSVVAATETTAEITEVDLKQYVGNLASDYMDGRLTGTEGERIATAYVAALFKGMGLVPAGDNGTYFQDFKFVAGVSLGAENTLTLAQEGAPESTFAVDQDWRPLAFSQTGAVEPAGVVFAGYGIVAPKTEAFEEYDSYVHLDVKDKWVLVFRYVPESISAEHRQHLSRYSSLRYKAMQVRDHGGKGLLVISGPNSKVEGQLVKMVFDVSLGGTSVAAISLTDSVGGTLLNAASKELKTVQDGLDDGSMQMGFEIPGVRVSAKVAIEKERKIGRNVIARLSGDPVLDQEPAIMVGAHVDHLGHGDGSSSLATGETEGAIHYGADDNASGIAAMIEIAQYLKAHLNEDRLALRRDVFFGAWSGEELGLLGSDRYVDGIAKALGTPENIRGRIAAYLNMDMVGRLETKLVLNGIGSSSIWPEEVERRNAPVGLAIAIQEDSYLPTDATSFYLAGVPILSAFTGSHSDYHKPSDTAEKLNYAGLQQIARFMALVTQGLAGRTTAPDYIAMKKPEERSERGAMRAYLGTVPDYAETDLKGVKLSGVTKDAPADKAGLKANDVIVEVAGTKIENIYDYTYAIQALKIGEEVKVVIERDGTRLELQLTPGSRE